MQTLSPKSIMQQKSTGEIIPLDPANKIGDASSVVNGATIGANATAIGNASALLYGVGSNITGLSGGALDLLFGKVATYSGTWTSNPNNLDKITDHNDSSYSQGVNTINTPTGNLVSSGYIKLDLGASFFITDIFSQIYYQHTAGNNSWGRVRYAIEASNDDSTYTTIYTAANISANTNVTESKNNVIMKKYRYVRVNCITDANSASSVNITGTFRAIDICVRTI